jgi:DNA-binding MarR family transcriptional regulator
MFDQSLTIVAEYASAVYRGILAPGEILLSWIEAIAPQTAAIMTTGNGGAIALLILTLLAWTLIVVAGLLLSRLCRKIAWQISALIRVFFYRVKMFVGDMKTRLIWKYREYFPHEAKQAQSVSHAQFDDMDIAVLASVSRRGPGMATSAPELAEKYKLRPAQIQDRLDKLAENHMLNSVMGSTDGYENYRLTDSGLALIAMCERQAAARVSPASASGSG